MSQDSIIKTYRFNPAVVEIELKDLSFIQQLPHLLGRPHRVAFYQLLWIKEGVFVCQIDFEKVHLKPGEMLVITPGQVCAFDIINEYKGSLVLFTTSFFSRTEEDTHFLYTAEILNPAVLIKKIALCPELLTNLITLLENELNRKEEKLHSAIAQNYLRILLLEAERGVNTVDLKVNTTLVRDFYQAVEIHFKHNRNSNFYSNLLGVSEKVLTKICKDFIGKTPKLYIDERIILEAKRLLSYSDQTIKMISFELGFEEPTNFIKYFRKHTKETPKSFREAQKRI